MIQRKTTANKKVETKEVKEEAKPKLYNDLAELKVEQQLRNDLAELEVEQKLRNDLAELEVEQQLGNALAELEVEQQLRNDLAELEVEQQLGNALAELDETKEQPSMADLAKARENCRRSYRKALLQIFYPQLESKVQARTNIEELSMLGRYYLEKKATAKATHHYRTLFSEIKNNQKPKKYLTDLLKVEMDLCRAVTELPKNHQDTTNLVSLHQQSLRCLMSASEDPSLFFAFINSSKDIFFSKDIPGYSALALEWFSHVCTPFMPSEEQQIIVDALGKQANTNFLAHDLLHKASQAMLPAPVKLWCAVSSLQSEEKKSQPSPSLFARVSRFLNNPQSPSPSLLTSRKNVEECKLLLMAYQRECYGKLMTPEDRDFVIGLPMGDLSLLRKVMLLDYSAHELHKPCLRLTKHEIAKSMAYPGRDIALMMFRQQQNSRAERITVLEFVNSFRMRKTSPSSIFAARYFIRGGVEIDKGSENKSESRKVSKDTHWEGMRIEEGCENNFFSIWVSADLRTNDIQHTISFLLAYMLCAEHLIKCNEKELRCCGMTLHKLYAEIMPNVNRCLLEAANMSAIYSEEKTSIPRYVEKILLKTIQEVGVVISKRMAQIERETFVQGIMCRPQETLKNFAKDALFDRRLVAMISMFACGSVIKDDEKQRENSANHGKEFSVNRPQ